jgi:hypothetical protein
MVFHNIQTNKSKSNNNLDISGRKYVHSSSEHASHSLLDYTTDYLATIAPETDLPIIANDVVGPFSLCVSVCICESDDVCKLPSGECLRQYRMKSGAHVEDECQDYDRQEAVDEFMRFGCEKCET